MRTIMAITLILTSVGYSIAGEAQIPGGWISRVYSDCYASDPNFEVIQGEEGWPAEQGKLLVRSTPANTKWRVACGGNSVGTTCKYEGYIVASFEGGKMMLGCYKGDIPAQLQK